MTAVGARVAWLFFGLCRASEFIACPALERVHGAGLAAAEASPAQSNLSPCT